MKTEFFVLGAFLLVLGGALMYLGPNLASTAFIRTEATLFTAQTGGSTNTNSTMASAYNQLLGVVNQAETISLIGVAVAPVGAAGMAYGWVAGKEHPQSMPSEDASTA